MMELLQLIIPLIESGGGILVFSTVRKILDAFEKDEKDI